MVAPSRAHSSAVANFASACLRLSSINASAALATLDLDDPCMIGRFGRLGRPRPSADVAPRREDLTHDASFVKLSSTCRHVALMGAAVVAAEAAADRDYRVVNV